jgi:hypothetical protein
LTLFWFAAVAGQAVLPRYSEEMLRCAVFREAVRTEIRSTAGSVVRNETAGRDGVIFFRAARGDSGLAVQLWFDTLTTWREGPEGRSVPDTDGLLGGRWRGLLGPTGQFSRRAVPFLPDDVAEIADLRALADDFLPLLPDTTLSHLSEYRWSRRAESDSTTVVDTIAVPVHRLQMEEGRLLWDAARGPLRWERTITVTARLPAAAPFRRGVSSTVKQLVRVERAGDDCRD